VSEKPGTHRAGDILGELLKRVELKAEAARSSRPEARPQAPPSDGTPAGRYDFDLAEFPLFRFYTNRLGQHGRDPLTYSDSIVGRDGKPVAREWKAYPGPFGFGGPSTHVLLYDLLQLYCEQGCQGSQIQFGTLRALLQRRGERNPSKRDYDRLRRDIDILRGYDFHAVNAFYDRKRGAYVDMKWRLFGSVFYFKERPDSCQTQMPFGFIEVSPVLQEVARTRGFFALGFESRLFYAMKPLEQRLSVYLAKKFISQKLHRRYADDLARALPIEAGTDLDKRKALRRAARGLLEKGLPILESFELEKSREGRWLAVFHRKAQPKQEMLPPVVTEEFGPAVLFLVDRIVEATGNADDRRWWTQCAKRLGQGPVDRALGQLKEACQLGGVRSRGALLTKIFKDLASEAGITLN
jgi:hypothetical protein